MELLQSVRLQKLSDDFNEFAEKVVEILEPTARVFLDLTKLRKDRATAEAQFYN